MLPSYRELMLEQIREETEYTPMQFPFSPSAKQLQKESDSEGFDKSKHNSRAAAEAESLGLVHLSFGRYADPSNPNKVAAYSVKSGDGYRLVKVDRDKDFDHDYAGRDMTDQEKADSIGSYGTPVASVSTAASVTTPTKDDLKQWSANPAAFKQWFGAYLDQFDLNDSATAAALAKKKLLPVGNKKTVKAFKNGIHGVFNLANNANSIIARKDNFVVVNGQAIQLPPDLSQIASKISAEWTDTNAVASPAVAKKSHIVKSTDAEKPVAKKEEPVTDRQRKHSNAINILNAKARFDARLSNAENLALPTQVQRYISEVNNDIAAYLNDPSPMLAYDLIRKHGIRTNSVDKDVVIGNVDQYVPTSYSNKKRAEVTLTAKYALNTKSGLSGNNAAGEISASEFLMNSLREQLGEETFDSTVLVEGGIKTMLRPDFIFAKANRTVDVKSSATGVTIDNKQYSKVFTKVDSDALADALLEHRYIKENVHRRNVAKLLGANADPTSMPPTEKTVKEAQRLKKIIDQRNFSVDLLTKLNNSRVADLSGDQFEGDTPSKKVFNAFAQGLTRAARRSDTELDASTVEALTHMSAMADLSNTSSDDVVEQFNAHWNDMLQIITRDDCVLKDSIPELCEVLSGIRLGIQGFDVYIPTDRNFAMIDAIGIRDAEGLNGFDEIDKFIDSVQLVHTSADLRSVKRGDGAAPSISSITDYLKFDEKKITVKPVVKLKKNEVPSIPDDPLDFNFLTMGVRDLLATSAFNEKIPEVMKYYTNFVNHPEHKDSLRKYFGLAPNTNAKDVFALINNGKRFSVSRNDAGEEVIVAPPDKSTVFYSDKAQEVERGFERLSICSAFGYLGEYILNNHVTVQGFTNEAFKDTGIERTDGIDSVAMFVYSGVSMGGAKGTIKPFRYKLVARSEEAAHYAGNAGAGGGGDTDDGEEE